MGIKDTLRNNKDKITQAVVEFGLSALLGWAKSLIKRRESDKKSDVSTPSVPTTPPTPTAPENPVLDTKTDASKAPNQITFIASPNFSARGVNGKIQAIILHHTGDLKVQSTISWFKSKESGVSAHYVIDRNGDIYQMVKDEDKAWHCGDSIFHDAKDVNRFSIGIELVGDGKAAFPKEQYDALAWLVRLLKARYKIENSWIAGHKDIAVPAGRKTDPEPFNWDLFWSLINPK